jgi:hypothetical protein
MEHCPQLGLPGSYVALMLKSLALLSALACSDKSGEHNRWPGIRVADQTCVYLM